MNDNTNLLQWTEEARALVDVADQLVRTSFVPLTYKTRYSKEQRKQVARDRDVVVAETVAAILAGQEVGLQPMAALRSIQIIHGTPALSAMAMRGLVQSAGHEVTVVEASESRAVVEGVRRGSEKVHRSVWTFERAGRLGLTSSAQWENQPQAMLVARATSEACRLTAADVLLGMPYSIEELRDGPDVAHDGPQDAPARKPATRTVKRRAPMPEPPLDAPPADEPELEPDDGEPGLIDPEVDPEASDDEA